MLFKVEDLTTSLSSLSSLYSFSMVTKLEQKISSYIRELFCLHNKTIISLHSSSSPFPLPMKVLLFSAKVCGQVLLWESADPCVSETEGLLKSGNWLASEAIEQTKKRLNFKSVLGYHKSLRAEFGLLSIPEVLPKHSFTGNY